MLLLELRRSIVRVVRIVKMRALGFEVVMRIRVPPATFSSVLMRLYVKWRCDGERRRTEGRVMLALCSEGGKQPRSLYPRFLAPRDEVWLFKGGYLSVRKGGDEVRLMECRLALPSQELGYSWRACMGRVLRPLVYPRCLERASNANE